MVSKVGAQKRALSKLPYTFETNERIMSLFETKEPQLNIFEKAHLKRLFHFSPEVTVTYDTGRYGVENGAIVNRTTVPGISTTLTVVSNNGCQFKVTRERGGVYYTDSVLTRVDVERFLRN